MVLNIPRGTWDQLYTSNGCPGKHDLELFKWMFTVKTTEIWRGAVFALRDQTWHGFFSKASGGSRGMLNNQCGQLSGIAQFWLLSQAVLQGCEKFSGHRTLLWKKM